MLRLYQIHWWALSSFLVPSIGFSRYTIMSSANSDSFASSFLIWIPFISFSSLISMPRSYKTMLNSSGERGHPCLVPDLSRNSFSFSSLRMLPQGLSYMAFIMLCVPSMPTFWSVFLSEMGSDCAKGFFCIYWKDHMVFILQFVNVMYHTDWFADIEEFLHPWDKSPLNMMYNPFNVLLDSVC